MIRKADIATKTKIVRCAVYCRVSTDERLGQDFNSLDAQREAGEAFIASRKAEGWVCLPDRFDDGGYSGANLNRPGVGRLMKGAEAGEIDCIVVYKVDRFTRSLPDLHSAIAVFDRHGVMFVSVTQPISTADSSGRLMLNILLSFAQFEREMISDRTRDKMSAARRRGKWTGGHAPLGYRVHEDGGRLIIDPDHVPMVEEIFQLYTRLQSLTAVAEELARRGWSTQLRRTATGSTWGGKAFGKTALHAILTNVVYIGKVRHRGEIYAGEHEGIIGEEIFEGVQKLLAANKPAAGARAQNRFGHLLRGLLHCSACGAAMSPSATKKGSKVYRYYTCTSAQRRGWRTCPKPSLPACEIEAALVERVKAIGSDPGLVAETLAQIKNIKATRQPALIAERRRLDQELSRLQGHGHDKNRDRAGKIEDRIAEIGDELALLQRESIDKRDLTRALAMFGEVWSCLYAREQERVIGLLVERVDFSAERETVSITFKPSGIRSLADEIERTEGAMA